MTIKDYCLQISKLLEEADHEKSKAFIQLGNLYVINREEALSNIKNIYGGMDSFNDFVLYKDEKVDIESNEKLSALREDLYKAVVSEIIELRS
jgi:hypothetical protein